MPAVRNNSVLRGITCRTLSTVLMLALALIATYSLYAKDKKKDKNAQEEQPNAANKDNRKLYESLDLSKFVWPNPPAITRIRYRGYWSGEKFVEKKAQQKKASWMDRLSGIATGSTPSDFKPRWQLVTPNGIAVDSKNLVYIADSKVRAIFILNVDTGEYSMIKNGSDGRFKWLIGLAIDDSDRLFAADSGMKRVVVFDKNHKVEGRLPKASLLPAASPSTTRTACSTSPMRNRTWCWFTMPIRRSSSSGSWASQAQSTLRLCPESLQSRWV